MTPAVRRRLMVAALGVATLLLLASFGGGLLTIIRLLEDTRREERALAVLAQADVVGFALAGAQSRHRYYLASGDETVGREYAGRRADWVREVAELREMVRDEEQVRRLAALQRVTARLFSRLDEALVSRELESGVADLALDAERQMAQFIEAERRILLDRRAQTSATATRSVGLVALVAALAVGLFVVGGALLRQARAERDRALAGLREAEERLELAIAGSDLAVWDWDVAADTVFLGDRWPRIVGGADGPVTLKSAELLRSVHPDDLEKVRYAVAASVSGGADAYEVEHRVRASDGSFRWINSRGRVVARDAAGRARRIAGTNVDISLRKSAELAVAEREQQLRLMADTVPAMIVDLDAEDRFRFCNRRYAEFFGVEPKALVGRPLHELIEGEGYERFRAAATAVRGGETVQYERELRRPGRADATLELRVAPQATWDGVYQGCYVVLTDVTRRRAAERALAEREAQLRLMADSVPAMIVDLDAEDRFRFCNRTYLEFFGREKLALVGRHASEVVDEEGYRLFTALAPRMRAGEPVTYEREIARPGARPVSLDVRVVPRRDADGRYSGCYVVLLDITERKRLERMKDEFVANVSHELRTPLTSIRASLGLLANGSAGSLAPDVAKLIEVARSSCERLVRLVNDILDFEKARRGRTMLNLAVLDAAEAARQAASANEGFARERGVALEVSVPAVALQVRADPDRVAQVLTNLISNAVKHTSAGGAVAIAVEPAGERVRFSIADRGPGVPAEFRERIFQQFAQAGKDLSVARSGTGLGLAISKAIVEQMGGAIGFDSVEGSGSVFWFDLPGAPA